MGYYPQIKAENFQDNLKFLDTCLYPRAASESIPTFLIYDNACNLTRSFKRGNVLQHFADRWAGQRWIVDRFHFHTHTHRNGDDHCKYACCTFFQHPALEDDSFNSLSDCRVDCNPYDTMKNGGLVSILECSVLGRDGREEATGLDRDDNSYRRSKTGLKVGSARVGTHNTKVRQWMLKLNNDTYSNAG